jgi:hypothetical protein
MRYRQPHRAHRNRRRLELREHQLDAAIIDQSPDLPVGRKADAEALGRRAINMLRPEARGRINGLFTGIFFLGSATGSALSGWAWAVEGWSAVSILGLVFAGSAFALGVGESRAPDKPSARFAETPAKPPIEAI